MAHLTIKNIGPIKDIDIDLNRINVFLGPQSSGKSTIAKIISFCQWIQKDVVIRQGHEHIDTAYVKRNLMDYHNMSAYFNENSEFYYCGRCVNIKFSKGSVIVDKSGEFIDAKISKNAYIPSERNMIGVPYTLSMDMPNNYLRGFLSDWISVRDKFRKSDPVKIINLGVSYFFDENTSEDKILINDGATTIPLAQASSGLQSTTPLFVYMKYLTDWVYVHEENRSAQRVLMIREGSTRRVLTSRFSQDLIDKQKDQFESLVKSLMTIPVSEVSGNNEIDSILSSIKEIENRLQHPDFSNIVIEEPEQNLFPETQVQLVYSLLEMFNGERDNLTITTHSPFVIYAINNCMMGYLSGKNIALIEKIISFNPSSCINPADVSIWELRDGYLQAPDKPVNETIQDNRGLIRDNYFDRVMKKLMVDFKNLTSLGMSNL